MLTPRPYLSWSQLKLLESSETRYIEQYVYGNKRGTNRGMAFGKQMADGLEKEEATGDPVLDLVMSKIPKFEIMDKELRTALKIGKEIVPLLIRPDSLKADYTAFKEYKVGQEPWSKKKVDEDGQLTFYATGLYCLSGNIPQDIELVHVETLAGEYGRIEATGNIYRHRTTRNMVDLLKMEVRIKKAWAKIQEIYSKELL